MAEGEGISSNIARLNEAAEMYGATWDSQLAISQGLGRLGVGSTRDPYKIGNNVHLIRRKAEEIVSLFRSVRENYGDALAASDEDVQRAKDAQELVNATATTDGILASAAEATAAHDTSATSDTQRILGGLVNDTLTKYEDVFKNALEGLEELEGALGIGIETAKEGSDAATAAQTAAREYADGLKS